MLKTIYLLLATVVQAWHMPDPSPLNQSVTLERGFLACHCSWTQGAELATIVNLGQQIEWLNGNLTKLMNESNLSKTQARVNLRGQAKEVLRQCFNESNYQGCINADKTNRKQKMMPLCSYDRNSDRNIARLESGEWVTEGICPIRKFDSNPQYFKLNSTRSHFGLTWCWCSPGGEIVGPPQKLIEARLHLEAELQALSKLSQDEASAQANSVLRKCAHDYSFAKCIEADKQLRGMYNYSMCRYDTVTGRNAGPDFLGDPQGLATLGHCEDNQDIRVLPAIAQDRGSSAVTTRGGKPASPTNEGCVAIRHFRKDAVLQHRWHLERDVLCWRRFCATPNHGVYFRGVYTSLGELCRANKCIRSRMLVNNLKITVQRRYRVDFEFVVTPYDVRFPWIVIWIVQIAEDVLELVVLSTFAGLVTTCVQFVVQVLQKSMN